MIRPYCRIILISVICSILFFFFCERNKNSISPDENNLAFVIYFLQDENLKIKDAVDMSSDSIRLQNKPWLTNKDIEMYDWSSHCIYLKKDKSAFIPGYGTDEAKDAGFIQDWYYKPFAVTAHNQLWYLGYFYPIIFTDKWLLPEINFKSISYYPLDIINIDYPWLYREDIRYKESIKNALIESGIFRGGISAELDTLDGINFIEIGDTSTIEYNIIITNNDQDNLLILDPDLAGSEIFHYYNTGIVLLDQQNNIYWSAYYSLLKSGDSIRRSIRLKGYTYIPDGEYYLQFQYAGHVQIQKAERKLSEGRYWIGPVRSDVYTCVKTSGMQKSTVYKCKNALIYNNFLDICNEYEDFYEQSLFFPEANRRIIYGF